MTRKSEFAQVEEHYTFPIEVEDEAGERSSVLVGAKALTQEAADTVLFDRDGLAYMRKPEGSLLLHVRAPQYDLDESETVTVKVTERPINYFPAPLFDQDDLGGKPIGLVQVKFTGYDGERRLLIGKDGKTYTTRRDGKPGVVLIEDPAETKEAQTSRSKRKR